MEPALLAAAFDHAALDQRLAVGEVEVPLGRLAAVAVEAMLDQDRADLLLEQGEPLLHLPSMVGRHARRPLSQGPSPLDDQHQNDETEKDLHAALHETPCTGEVGSFLS